MVSNSPSKQLSLKRNMLWNSIGSFIKVASNWIATVIVVRLSHGFDAAGLLALAMSISNTVVPLAEFRMRTFQVTDIQNERTASNYVAMRLMTTPFAFCIGLLYTLLTYDLSAFTVIVLYMTSQLILTFGEGFHAIQQRANRMDYIGISYALQGFMTLTSFSIGIAIFNSLVVSTCLLILGSSLIIFLYDLKMAAQFESVCPVFDFRDSITTLLKLLPLVGVGIALNVVALIPRQFLAVDMGEAALGIYASVSMPAIIVQVGAGYIYTPLLGKMTDLFHSDRQKFFKIQIYTILGILAIAICASVMLLFIGEPFLAWVFGNNIRPYTYLIQPALLLSFVTAVVWYFNDLLLGLRNMLGCFTGGIVAVIVTLIATPSFGHFFEMNGPSATGIAAYLAAFVAMLSFLLYESFKKSR